MAVTLDGRCIKGDSQTVRFCDDLDDTLRYINALLVPLILTGYIEDAEPNDIISCLACIRDITQQAKKITHKFSVYLGHDTEDESLC